MKTTTNKRIFKKLETFGDDFNGIINIAVSELNNYNIYEKSVHYKIEEALPDPLTFGNEFGTVMEERIISFGNR